MGSSDIQQSECAFILTELILSISKARVYSMSEHALYGRWMTDPEDEVSLRESEQTSLVFEPDGKLTYIVHGANKDQIVNLIYRVEGPVIVTNQPSAPREERTTFKVTSQGKLILEFGGVQSQYVRAS